jgi:hypothetical protein
MAIACADELRRLIQVIDDEIAKLPPLGSGSFRTRFHEASDAAATAIAQREGGKFLVTWDGAKLTLGGIRSSCTAGSLGVMSNWKEAAFRSIQKQMEAAS